MPCLPYLDVIEESERFLASRKASRQPGKQETRQGSMQAIAAADPPCPKIRLPRASKHMESASFSIDSILSERYYYELLAG
jgi:hypothetical protein